MLTTFFVGIIIGTQWPAELKSFTKTGGIHTALLIGTNSLLSSILRPAQTQRSTPPWPKRFQATFRLHHAPKY
jgi:hypothetical protein